MVVFEVEKDRLYGWTGKNTTPQAVPAKKQ